MDGSISRLKAEILKAMGHPARISIIEYLRQGERCVCEIFARLNMEQSNVSQHLAILKKSGILASRKEGLRVIYWIKNPEILTILDMLQEVIIRQLHDSAGILEGLGQNQEPPL